MAIGANTHHSAYLQSASFPRARRLLMHDLDERSDEAAKWFLHLDFDTKPASSNLRPEKPQEKAGQVAVDEFPFKYNRSAAAFSGVDYWYHLPIVCMVPTYLPSSLGPPACNLVYQGVNPHRAHPPAVEPSISFDACEAWRHYLYDDHGVNGPSHGGPFYTPHCRARLPGGICYEFYLVDLSRTPFQLLDLCDRPFYTGMSQRYTWGDGFVKRDHCVPFPPF